MRYYSQTWILIGRILCTFKTPRVFLSKPPPEDTSALVRWLSQAWASPKPLAYASGQLGCNIVATLPGFGITYLARDGQIISAAKLYGQKLEHYGYPFDFEWLTGLPEEDFPEVARCEISEIHEGNLSPNRVLDTMGAETGRKISVASDVEIDSKDELIDNEGYEIFYGISEWTDKLVRNDKVALEAVLRFLETRDSDIVFYTKYQDHRRDLLYRTQSGRTTTVDYVPRPVYDCSLIIPGELGEIPRETPRKYKICASWQPDLRIGIELGILKRYKFSMWKEYRMRGRYRGDYTRCGIYSVLDELYGNVDVIGENEEVPEGMTVLFEFSP